MKTPQTPPDALLAIHRYLFPERYEDVPMYEWHAGTIEDVAAMLEEALVNANGLSTSRHLGAEAERADTWRRVP